MWLLGQHQSFKNKIGERLFDVQEAKSAKGIEPPLFDCPIVTATRRRMSSQ